MTSQDAVPSRLRTLALLRTDGLVPKNRQEPTAFLERTIDGDLWRTELYDPTTAVLIENPDATRNRSVANEIHPDDPLIVVAWTRHSRPIIAARPSPESAARTLLDRFAPPLTVAQ